MTDHGGAMTPQQALDTLLYEDVSGVRTKKLIIELRKYAENGEWAEDFLDKGGIDALLKLAKNTSGSVQGIILQAVRAFMVYVNALDRFADSPELVERMFSLLYPPEPNAPVNLTVAKAALELLNVICGKLENGHHLINEAAKKKTGVDLHPYANFGALLSSNDLICVSSTLLLMNLLMSKRKNCDELAAKRLVFRWKQAGLFALLEPLAALDDAAIQKQLSVLQRAADYTIPRSWVEAHKYKSQYMDVKRRLDNANEQLFVLQQQQAKVRLMKLEFARAQTTLRALGAIMPTLDTTPHPTKRYTEGGGISLQQLRSPDTEAVDLDTAASRETSDIQKKLMEALLKQPDFASIAEGMMGAKLGAGRRVGGAHVDPVDEDFPPPPSDSDDESVDLPPPHDTDSEGDLPPPEDGPEGDMPSKPSVGPKVVPKAGDGTDGTSASPDAASASPTIPTQGALDGSPGTATSSSPLQSTPSADTSSSPQLGEQAVTAAAAGARAPPPPPPPPPGKKGGPPPPPPVGGKGIAGAKSVPERPWYNGPAPSKKMRPLHWDKWGLDDAQLKDSLWGRIHNGGDVKCDFDFEEFESMFCQKEVEAKAPKEKKPEKVLLVDAKTYQNLSIMLHKLPTIPTIQNALLTLDADTLEPQMILAMIDQKLLTPDVYKQFTQKQSEKRVEEYEPPEQFVAMTMSVPEFRRRCTAWLFTMEWGGNIASALKPIHRLNAAMSAVLKSQHLPYFLGLLLGFGNVMNYGNAAKGNAPAMAISVLSKIEASKDNRGKVSLLQHMLDTARQRNPDALDLHEELKPLFDNVVSLKVDDLEKSVQEAEKQLAVFHRDCAAVRKALEEAGAAMEDPFIPYTADFNTRASEELEKIKLAFAETQRLSTELQKYLGVPPKKPMKPEEIFAELFPFVDKVRVAAADAAKEKKRLSRKGQKLDSDIGNVLGALQSEIASGSS